MRIKYYLTLLILFAASLDLHAAEPTTPASNIVVDNINCVSARISWTSGNGSWRTVLVKEGAAVDALPVDGDRYTSNTVFAGTGASEIGTGNFVCYNSAANVFTLTGLKQNTTYYIAIFEHDALSPDYLTSNPATASFTTRFLNMDFSYSYTDSCQGTNVIDFKNKSTTDLPGVTYTWYFKDGNQTTGYDVKHTYLQGGNFPVQIIVTPSGGCPNTFTTGAPVRVIPRPVSKPIEKNGNYSQCFTGNHFYFNDQTSLAPVPKCAYVRTWYFSAIDIATFPTPDRVFAQPGTYRIFFEAETLYDNKKTGCKDTTSLVIKVIADPSSGVTVNDTQQCLAGNEFDFDNNYPGLVSFSWDFDDGGSAITKAAVHTFADTGEYHVLHKAASVEGCKSEVTKVVFVMPNFDASFIGLPPELCEGDPSLLMVPQTAGGNWYLAGSKADSLFTPTTPGVYDVMHIIPDSVCPDTVIKKVTVKPLPKFTLGPDANICNGASFSMTVNAPATGKILWDDGSTAPTRSVTDAGQYWAQVTDSGCIWKDEIELFIGNTPVVQLPGDTSLCKGSVLQLSADWPGSTILWSNGSREKSIYVTSEGLYSVTVTNPCGTATDDIKVHYQGDFCDVFIPDAFTPNGDGRNEYFEILGKAIIPKMFIIYDRWGAKVFDSRTSNTFRWDGKHNGLPCGDAMYSYVFYYEVIAGDFRRKNTIKGSLLLYR